MSRQILTIFIFISAQNILSDCNSVDSDRTNLCPLHFQQVLNNTSCQLRCQHAAGCSARIMRCTNPIIKITVYYMVHGTPVHITPIHSLQSDLQSPDPPQPRSICSLSGSLAVCWPAGSDTSNFFMSTSGLPVDMKTRECMHAGIQGKAFIEPQILHFARII